MGQDKNKDISKKHTFVICAYQESEYLERCVRSVIRQSCKSTVIMSTGTPNRFIKKIAEKYHIPLFINDHPSSLANDWNFALRCTNTELVTLAHQDDIYEPDYSLQITKAYEKAKKVIILFSDYYELRGNKKVLRNQLICIKRAMLFPLCLSICQKNKFIRRRILSFGNAICCPAVTFVRSEIPVPLFENNMKSNIDWQAWELLSKREGSFVYIPKPLMLHRIHEDSTTSELLEENGRVEEDLSVLYKFWPKSVAQLIEKWYQRSEKSNTL